MAHNGYGQPVLEAGPFSEERGLGLQLRLTEDVKMGSGRTEAYDLEIGFQRRDPLIGEGGPTQRQDQGITTGPSATHGHGDARVGLAFGHLGENLG